MSTEKDKKKLATKLKPLFDGIYNLIDDNGIKINGIFQVLPDRKLLDYYKVIKTPFSLNMVKKKLTKPSYYDPQGFVNDLVQITWNARTYNLKGSSIYNAAVILDNYVKDVVIPKIKSEKSILKHDLVFYPNLGPLPEFEANDNLKNPTSSLANEEDADAESDHESNDDAEEDEDEQATAKPRKGKTSTPVNSKMDAWVKRGRPPVIDRPHEQRIKNILRNLKKIKNPTNNTMLFAPFDRLPDARVYPDYYQHIENPMSIDTIRIKVKQRKYADVDSFIEDMHLIIKNCKSYNDPNSSIFQDCMLFEVKVNELIKDELSKPESNYLSSDAGQIKVPLDQLELHGKVYKIGDWVLINNPNDGNKPTVAQIFRIWATDDNKRWINVCWYYRPEQTVHRVSRLFYENEVCKTGQYRDHVAEEIIGKCYVMFSTRYQKGDPAVPFEGPFFLCEYRYNDENNVFNRIRTWKACLPDEVRDIEDPIIPINGQRRLQRFESPIKHLLPNDAKMDMPIPQPTIGAPNAPPIVGAVYLRPPSPDDDAGQYSTNVQPPKASSKQVSQSPAPQLNTPNSTFNSLTTSRNSFQASTPQQQTDQSFSFRNSQLSYNKIHHATTVYSQPTPSPAFTLPRELQEELKPYSAALTKMDSTNYYNKLATVGIATNNLKQEPGPIIWYRSPPVKLASRIQNLNLFDLHKLGPIRKKRRAHAEGNENDEKRAVEIDEHVDAPGAGFAGLGGLGHSAEYISWTIKRQRSDDDF